MLTEASVQWIPHPKQQDVLTCPADDIFYGGSAGGGKTALLIFDFALHEKEWGKDAHGLILRRTYPETEEIRSQAFQMLMSLPSPPKWHATDKKFTFRSGADLEIGHLDNREDLTRYIGRPFTWIGKDELPHWATSYEHDFLMSRMRSTNPNLQTRCLSTGNPGGVGHNWVMKRWHIDDFPDGHTPFTDILDIDGASVSSTRIFFPAKLEDNPSIDNALNRRYRAKLMGMDEKHRKMLLDGRWDVTEGAFFPEWDPLVHIMAPKEIPREWPRWMGMDWGTAKPYWAGWATMTPWGEVWLYRELYPIQPDDKVNVGSYENAHQVAKKIQDIERMSDEYVKERYLDYSCFSDSGISESEGGSPLTTASIFARYDLNFQKSMKSNKPGAIQLFREYLAVNNKQSRFRVFSTCKNFIRVVSSIQGDSNNPSVYNSDGEDHPCLSGDTEVLTDFGWRTIRELHEQDGIGGLDVFTPVGPYKATDFIKTGIKQTYRMQLSNGSYVDATADHRFLVAGKGFTRLDQTITGDILLYGGGHDTNGYFRDGARVSRGEILQMRDVLPAQWLTLTPDSVDVCEWPDSKGVQCSSCGRESCEQCTIESQIDGWARSFKPSYDSSQKGMGKGECEEGHSSSSNVAPFTGGDGLAQGERDARSEQEQRDMGSNRTPALCMLLLPQHVLREERFILLHSHLPNSGVESKYYGVYVKSIEPKTVEPVYDIRVKGPACFLTSAGVFAHNCDGVLYLLRKNIPLTDEENERKIRASQHLTRRMNQYKLGRGCR